MDLPNQAANGDDFFVLLDQSDLFGESNLSNYETFVSLFVSNQEKEQKVIQLRAEKLQLVAQLRSLKRAYGKHKRKRRRAKSIERSHQCDLCPKAYGSEGSLKAHIKLKHSTNNQEL